MAGFAPRLCPKTGRSGRFWCSFCPVTFIDAVYNSVFSTRIHFLLTSCNIVQ
ncbi:4Fe-4S binding protein [Buttiauxella gaviniae]|uniref:4Fe-4S binding protein n=1 Tax=Buttiauxella gaviniae TaxID=82990 RepID=UPI003F5ACB45